MATTTGQRVKKFTTIEELEKSTIGPVFVINETEGSLEGNIIISIPKKNGNGVDLIKIAKTFIPIDVSQQVSRTQILEASDFRKTVGKGMIKLVTPEYAKLLLEQPEAKEEQKRLIEEANKARNILAKAGVTEDNSDSEDEDDDGYIEVKQISKDLKNRSEKKKVAKAKPSIKIEELAITAKSDGLQGSAIVAKLRNIRKLSKVDLAYLAKEFAEKKKVIDYLKLRLKAIREQEAEA